MFLMLKMSTLTPLLREVFMHRDKKPPKCVTNALRAPLCDFFNQWNLKYFPQ